MSSCLLFNEKFLCEALLLKSNTVTPLLKKLEAKGYIKTILLGLPCAKILSFDDGPIHPCTYEETDSYRVTSMFINNREQILHRLLNE